MLFFFFFLNLFGGLSIECCCRNGEKKKENGLKSLGGIIAASKESFIANRTYRLSLRYVKTMHSSAVKRKKPLAIDLRRISFEWWLDGLTHRTMRTHTSFEPLYAIHLFGTLFHRAVFWSSLIAIQLDTLSDDKPIVSLVSLSPLIFRKLNWCTTIDKSRDGDKLLACADIIYDFGGRYTTMLHAAHT